MDRFRATASDTARRSEQGIPTPLHTRFFVIMDNIEFLPIFVYFAS
jgi:hypothetical protein